MLMPQLIAGLRSRRLVYARVGEFNSLSVGFGEIVSEHPKSLLPYAELHCVCYERSWRILQKGKLFLSGITLDSATLIQRKLDRIDLAELDFISEFSRHDVEIKTVGDTAFQFFGMSSRADDDLLVVFREEERRCGLFIPSKGWKVGPSDRPVTRENSGPYHYLNSSFKPGR